MSKIKLDIPNINAKNIVIDDIEYTIPTITLYHRRFFGDPNSIKEDGTYDIVVPVLKKILKLGEDNIPSYIMERLIIELLCHNKILNRLATINDEKFNINDIELENKNEFYYNGETYKFRYPEIGELFESNIDGMNKLQMDSEYDFGEMEPIFYQFGFKLFSTVKIKGSNGNIIRGLNNIIDTFINMEELAKIRR